LAFGWSDLESLRSVADEVIRLTSDVSDPVAKAMATVRALVARDIVAGWSADDSAEGRTAVEVVVRGQDVVEAASARIMYALFQLRESAYSDVIRLIQEDLPVVRKADRFVDVFHAEWALTWALLHHGEWGRMRSVATSVILAAAKLSNAPMEALFTYLLAWLHLECGAYDSALEFCSNARRVHTDSGSALESALAATVRGFAELGTGRPDAALMEFASARQARPNNRDLWFVLSQVGTIESLLVQRDVTAGFHAAEALYDQIAGFPEKTWTAVALRSCARAAAANGDWEKAVRRIDEALKLVNESDLPLAAWRVYGTASEIYAKTGEPHRSGEFLEKSRASALSLAKSLDQEDALNRAFAELSSVAERTRAVRHAAQVQT
jgi:tetratricopeptide (TPR) repeat protein